MAARGKEDPLAGSKEGVLSFPLQREVASSEVLKRTTTSRSPFSAEDHDAILFPFFFSSPLFAVENALGAYNKE